MINSVGSGIGSAAVQLAHLAGATVIGNASSDEKLARAAELGMDHGINHATQDVVEEVMRLTDGRGVDLVFEHVGGELFQKGLDSLAKDGRLVICGGHSGEVVPFDIIPFFRGQKQVIGSFVYNRDEVETCLELARQGKITPLVHKTFPLDEAREAMAMMERREHFGKIVLKPEREARVKRLGVDVGGTFTDLIYVDDEAGQILVHKLPTTPDDPSQGTVQGIRELTEHAGAEPSRARPGLPRDDDRDEHRDRAQRRPGRDDHDRGLPRHPPHRAAQEAAQLLELPGPAVAAVPDRPAPLPADRAGADHARRLGARPARRGGGARAGAPR